MRTAATIGEYVSNLLLLQAPEIATHPGYKVARIHIRNTPTKSDN